jgi:hypothetical protein
MNAVVFDGFEILQPFVIVLWPREFEKFSQRAGLTSMIVDMLTLVDSNVPFEISVCALGLCGSWRDCWYNLTDGREGG